MLNTEGSSRTSALIRIGLAALVWARFGGELLLYKHDSPEDVVFAITVFLISTCMFVGFYSRISSFLTGFLVFFIYYGYGVAFGYEPWTHHHVYLLAIGCVLTALTPAGNSYSLDRWLLIRNGAALPERGNLLGLYLMMLQLSIMYLGSAFDKTTYAFLSGERLESIFMYFYTGSNYPDFPFYHLIMVFLAVSTVAIEYALAFGLLFQRTRKWLIVPGLLFHGILYITLPVSTFTATVWVMYLAYLNADAVHRFIDRMSSESPTISSPPRAV